MNAAAALNVSAAKLAQHAESVSLCLSKSVSAPVGAVLAATSVAIVTARVYRKMLGGTQRPVSLEALQSMTERLSDDHAKALSLSKHLNALSDHRVLTRPWGDDMLRCVARRHINDDDIVHSTDTFTRVLEQGIQV